MPKAMDEVESNVKLVFGLSASDHTSRGHSGGHNDLSAGGLSGNTATRERRATVHGEAT